MVLNNMHIHFLESHLINFGVLPHFMHEAAVCTLYAAAACSILIVASVHMYACMCAGVSRLNGTLKWCTLVDDDPTAIITASGVAVNDTFYIGVSSGSERASFYLGAGLHEQFRGSLVALNVGIMRISE